MWENKQRVVCVRFSIIETVDDYFDLSMKHSYTEVQAVDGFLNIKDYNKYRKNM